tara:strand:+ start:830 stop:1597 length:768 start_codon:yes stop_codon:yes gene_type:complete
VWLGIRFNFKIPAYTIDPNLVSGSGIYEAHEWSLTRKKGHETYGTDGSEYDNNKKYLQYIFTLESKKIHQAISLKNHLDFTKYSHVLEFGCGSMVPSFVIKNSFPHLSYLATDYDPYIIEQCSKLSLLDGIDKAVFDLRRDKMDNFANVDLLICWGLDACIKDEYILKLLSFAKDRQIPLVMRTSSSGIIEYIFYKKSLKKTKKLLVDKKLRMMGWKRSIGYFKKLAKKEKMNVRIIGEDYSTPLLQFTPKEGIF